MPLSNDLPGEAVRQQQQQNQTFPVLQKDSSQIPETAKYFIDVYQMKKD